MRLLHIDHSKALLSTDFSGKAIPPYAILSHRWGESEVLFENLVNGTHKEKEGYRKVEFCAERAALDQLEYFWIDTCCIHKWNLRERSIAINAMFRWYKNAARCYVYLSDVSISTATEISQSAWETSFRASEWFTRGWTLQELIAPPSVEFFSCEGIQIGDKTSLEQMIHEITSIPLKALQNCPLDEFTESERMKWAGDRKTTEEEDNVYCLLGILKVVMPTAYGEGVKKALRRLQIELEAASNAPSIIPFSQNDSFVGNEPQITELEIKLFRDREATRMAIVGPPGTGKSQLALEFAHRTRQKKNCSVFWIDAGDTDSIYRSYASIAQKLEIPGWDDEKADVRELVTLHLSRTGERPFLLIFDNTEDVILGSNDGLSMARATNLVDYLPQSDICSIVFTTTNYDTAKRLAPDHIVEQREMTPDTAQRMFENYLTDPIVGNEQREAKLLLQELSYLPLAIVQAATYINTRKVAPSKYRTQVHQQEEVIRERSSEPQAHDTTDPVATTLLISLDQIRGSNALAANFLFFAACVDPKDIPLDLLEASSPREREDAIKVLSSYALVTRRPSESALDLHQLVHRALREWLRKQEQLDQWTRTASRQLLKEFPDPDHRNNHRNSGKWRRLLPHAKYALSHSLAEQEDEVDLALASRCAVALYNDGRWTEAEQLEVQVMEMEKKLLGKEHPDTLHSITNLTLTLWSQGRWAESEELEVQVMETRKRVLGPEHPDTLTSISNLALTLWEQGRWKEAEQLNMQVLETQRRVLGNEHPNTLISRSNLALIYGGQGQWAKAEQLNRQVMETQSRVLGQEHPNTLNSMANLASLFWEQGRLMEAEKLEAQVIEIQKRVLGTEHPSTITSIGNLALMYRDLGRRAEAEQLEVQVVEIKKRMLGVEHPSTITSMGNLALMYRDQGRWAEAEQLEVQVIEMKKRVFKDEHPSTLISMGNLALTFSNQGRLKEAEQLELQVMETKKRVLGDEHPSTLTTIHNRALTLEKQGRTGEAISLMETVLEIGKRVFGPGHSTTISSYNALDKWRRRGT